MKCAKTHNLKETIPTTFFVEGGFTHQHLPWTPVKTHLLLLGIHSWNRLVKNKAQKLLFLLKALLSNDLQVLHNPRTQWSRVLRASPHTQPKLAQISPVH